MTNRPGIAPQQHYSSIHDLTFFKYPMSTLFSGAIRILTIPFMIYQTINLGQTIRVQDFNDKSYG